MTNIATTTKSHLAPDTLTLASATRPSLAVYDGQTRLGYLVRRGSNFEAFDNDDVSYGTFTTMRAAAFAVPARSASS
jgi:hypothetical protein